MRGKSPGALYLCDELLPHSFVVSMVIVDALEMITSAVSRTRHAHLACLWCAGITFTTIGSFVSAERMNNSVVIAVGA